MAMLFQYMPCMPGIPIQSGWEPGKPPIPRRVVTTGICAFSASSCSSSKARDILTPWPARIRGLSDSSMSWAAFLIWPGGPPPSV